MGLWSEDSSGSVFHDSDRLRAGEQAVKSGDVGLCDTLKGSLVGCRSSFRMVSVASWSSSAVPLGLDGWPASQEGWRPLRSPHRMRFEIDVRSDKSGW